MGEAFLSGQGNSINSGTKHKEQWLSIEDPNWITIHNKVTLPSPDSVSTITLKLPNNSISSRDYIIYNGLTQSINLIPNSIICIKNIFTTTATSSSLTTDERYVYYYDSQYNQIGQSTHYFSSNNFSTSRIATAYPCSAGMGSQEICDQNHGIVQLKGNGTQYYAKYGILVPEDGIVNIAIGISQDQYNNLSKLSITCTTQYSYVNFLEHFSEEEYEYHKTLKSIESNSQSVIYSSVPSYFNQISNSYIPTINAVNEIPREDCIFFYNGTLYAYYFYTDISSSNNVRYKVYK